MEIGSGATDGGVAADGNKEEKPTEQIESHRGEKRKAEEEIDRDEDPGMDIDHIKNDSNKLETLGGTLARLSIVDEELEQWRDKLNSVGDGVSESGSTYGAVGTVGKVDVAEIYSPARITLQAKRFGLRPGEAMNLMTG